MCSKAGLAFWGVVLFLTLMPIFRIDVWHLFMVVFVWLAVWGFAWCFLRTYRAHLVALAILLPLAGLTGEALFRVYVFGFEGLSFHRYRPAGYAHPWSAFAYSTNSYTGLKPNQSVWFKGRRFTVNHHGFRGRDVPWKKPDGVFRMVVTGASASMGAGVRDEEVLFARLEDMLNETLPDRTVEVINLSLGGASMGNMLHALRHAGMAYEPNMILFFVDRGGLREDPSEEAPLRVGKVDASLWRLVAEPRYRFFNSCFFFFQAAQGHAFRWQNDLARKGLPIKSTRRYAPVSPDVAEEHFDAALDRLQELAGTIPVVLYMLRPYGRRTFGDGSMRFEDYLMAAAEARGMGVLPLRSEMEIPYARHELAIYPGDGHPNALLHRLFAEALVDELVTYILETPAQKGGL